MGAIDVSTTRDTQPSTRPAAGLDDWWKPAMHRRLVAFARRFVGDAGEAEDIAQETLMRAGAGPRQLRSPDRAEAWLFRICRHAAIDLVRSRRVRRAVWGQLPEDASELGPIHEDASAEDAGGAELDLADVPAHHRLLLDLHYRKGLSQPVLCRMTGLSPSALRVRLYRARRALSGPVKAASPS